MTEAPLSALHCFTEFSTLGGVQAILRTHHKLGTPHRYTPSFVAYFEEQIRPINRVYPLGLSPSSCIHSSRCAMRDALGERKFDVAIHHVPWGMRFLAELDGARRRIFYLHGRSPDLYWQLPARTSLIDGIICVSEETRQLALSVLPGLDDQRVQVTPHPIPHVPRIERAHLDNRPPTIGYIGRLDTAYKRADRIPAFCHAMRKKNQPFTLMIIGDGPERKTLERHPEIGGHVRFCGRLTGESYWAAVSELDFVLFTSDSEGLPLALLEAMRAGALPLFPEIGTAGDQLIRQINPALVYPPGDLEETARRVGDIVSLPPDELHRLREAAVNAVAGHTVDSHFSCFRNHCQRLLDLPRISTSEFPNWRWPTNRLSFTTLARLRRWRQFVGRFK